MKRRILFAVLCVAATLALSSCDLFSSLFWKPVSISEAHEAFTASAYFLYAGLNDTTNRVDNGSNPDYAKFKDPAGTLTWEGTLTSGGYPATYVTTGNSYAETGSGYSFSGTVTETDSSSTAGTLKYNLDMSHDTKPVQKITGTLSVNSGTWSGSLQFNNDSYTYSQFVY